MTEKQRIRRMASLGGLLCRCSASGLLLLGLLVLQLGCQEETTAPGATSVQTEPSQAVITAEPAEPVAGEESEVGEAATPVEITNLAKPQVINAPKITLAKTVHDFGEVGPGTTQSTRFEFTNEGTAALRITEVQSCCGVVTRGVKAGQEYAPGQGGALEVAFQAGDQPAMFQKRLHIASNDPLHGVVTLTIQAKIARRIDYTPPRLKLFLRKENAGAKDITLTSLDGREFSITGFRATQNAISADFDRNAKGTKFVLTPRADMEKLKRNLRGWVQIDLTHPECKSVRLPYDVLPEFSFDLEQILLFNLKAGQAVNREIWLLNNYRDDFEIESISSQKGTVKLLGKEKIENRYRLKLEILPPQLAGEKAVMSDVIEIKIKDGETLTLPVRGFY